MAMIFTFSRPSALKVRPATPGVPRIFSPTTATIAMSGSSVMCSTFSCVRSCANGWRSASTVRFASEDKTIKQISFCEEDCEIKSTFARDFRSGGKGAADHVRYADNRRTAEGDESDVADGGEGLDPASNAAALGRDFRAGSLRREAIADPDGDAGGHNGAERFRVQDFRAEIGELGGFAIGNLWDSARVGNKTRVGGEHAIHIRPDNDFVRVESGAENGGGIIGAAAAERGEHAFAGCADESGHHGNNSLLQKRAQAGLGAFLRVVHQRLGAAMIGIGDDQFGGVD